MKFTKTLLAAALALSAGLAMAQAAPGASQFLVKPYLQIGRVASATSLELMWQASAQSADWAVEYQAQAGGAWQQGSKPTATLVAVAGMAPRWIYRSTMDGLASGSSFAYRVTQAGTPVFSAQAQAPKSAQQAFTTVIFGDVGAGTPEQKAIAQRAYLSKPDVVVVPGDIVYEYGLMSEYDKNFWPIYNADAVAPGGVPLMRSVPMVTVPGNHDIDNRNLEKYPDGLAYFFYWDMPLNGPMVAEGGPAVPALKASADARKNFLAAAGDAYPRMANYSFDYGNTHWTVLDSNPYVDWTSKELTDWVAQDLAAAQGATWRFVTFHHPGFNSSNEHYEQQHMRLLSPAFEAGKVDLVFSGHLHNYQRSLPMTFAPIKKGTVLVGGRDGTVIRGRVVNGRWVLDHQYDGRTHTQPKGIIYVVTGAGGKELYNMEQHGDPDSWQKVYRQVHLQRALAHGDGRQRQNPQAAPAHGRRARGGQLYRDQIRPRGWAT